MKEYKEDLFHIALFAALLAVFNACTSYAIWDFCLYYGPIFFIPYAPAWGITLWIASQLFLCMLLIIPLRNTPPKDVSINVKALFSPQINAMASSEWVRYKRVVQLQNMGSVFVLDWALFPGFILRTPFFFAHALITLSVYFLISCRLSRKQEIRLQQIDKSTAFACRALILSKIWSPENKIYQKLMYRSNKGPLCLCLLAGLLRKTDNLQEADHILSLTKERATAGSQREQLAYDCECLLLSKLGVTDSDGYKIRNRLREQMPDYMSLVISGKRRMIYVEQVMAGILLLESDGDWENMYILCHKLIDSKLPEWKKFDAWVACYRADLVLHKEEEAAELLTKIREYSEVYAERYLTDALSTQ